MFSGPGISHFFDLASARCMKGGGNHGKNGRRLRRELEPPAEILARVREILEECSFRVGQVMRTCSEGCGGRAGCCRFRETGEVPHVTLGEAWVAWKAWRATGRVRIELPGDGACPFLDPVTSLCRIYAHRPLACRSHFCSSAGGVVPRKLVSDLLQELEDIDSRCGGDGPVRLPDVEERLAWK